MSPADHPQRPFHVGPTRRHLVDADGRAVFYLADTAWELFHRLDDDETRHYLDVRASQGFRAIHAAILAELDGLSVPNRQGHLPLHDLDPARPDERYFADVDRTVTAANDAGLSVGMLPTWGDKVHVKWGPGPAIFTPENAETYGRYVGRRYRDADVLWVLGGDREVADDTQRAIWRAMALGLRDGDGGRHLITYHPLGRQRSGMYWPQKPWLDLHQCQSGHACKDSDNAALLADDLATGPPKPAMDGEPCYEDHPVMGLTPASRPQPSPWFDEHDARRAAWRAVAAGACGHVYGAHGVWQFFDPDRHPPVNRVRTQWRDALHLPAATQMRHIRATYEDLAAVAPPLPRDDLMHLVDRTDVAPADKPGVLACVPGEGGPGVTRAMIYFPRQAAVRLDATRWRRGSLEARWLDPRTGVYGEPRPLDPDATIRPPANAEQDACLIVSWQGPAPAGP